MPWQIEIKRRGDTAIVVQSLYISLSFIVAFIYYVLLLPSQSSRLDVQLFTYSGALNLFANVAKSLFPLSRKFTNHRDWSVWLNVEFYRRR